MAEDHPIARQRLIQLLGSTDDIVVVGEASDGQGALDLAAEPDAPDVLLIDLRMPGIDGLEATRRLREDHPEVNVVILTAHDDPRWMSDAVEAGAKAYVLKSADADEMLETIRMVASGHVVFDSVAWRAVAERRRGADEPPPKLSKREYEVLVLLADGRGNAEIAEELGVSLETVKTHVERLYKRLGVGSRTDAVAKALRAGIIR